MILAWLVIIPLAAGVAGWILSRWCLYATRWLCLAAMAADFLLALTLWPHGADSFGGSLVVTGAGLPTFPVGSSWLAEVRAAWIPPLGISFHLAADGLSLLMVLLTTLLGTLAVATSWTEIRERVGFFHFNLMLVLAGIVGVFLAMDLFLFYFFWELMLVPMYFLIDIWGHENRHYAAVKFFLFTQLSGLVMLLAILGLVVAHGVATGRTTFDFVDLLGTPVGPTAGLLLALGFLAAFAVKLPVLGLHTWLPDAHTEAPTAGSLILAGLLLKTGAYGMLRFVLPLFPGAAADLAPVAMTLGVAGILYGAVLAFAQTDFKRMVAYTSVSHLGFVLLGIFAGTTLAIQGAVMQMICHGLSTGALFILVGMIQQRIGTRDLRRMGGLWTDAPRMGGMAMIFAMASLGLPGLGNFIGEFLVLLGVWPVSPVLTIVATVGLVAATVYSLWMMQQAFHGPPREAWHMPDLRPREMAVLAVLVVALVGLGLYPQPVLDASRPPLTEGDKFAAELARRFLDKLGDQGMHAITRDEFEALKQPGSHSSSGSPAPAAPRPPSVPSAPPGPPEPSGHAAIGGAL
jgi:NADH-quinone oxidoreductase subunit M